MIEIEMAFEYFDEGVYSTTKELQEVIDLYNDNYLIYYIFYNNYCIFSNIEITKSEAETLTKIIESDNGLDILYGEGIQTDYAKYIMLKKEKIKINKEKDINNKELENKFEKYVNNIIELNKIYELEKRNKLYKKKIEILEADNEVILELKELLKEYQKLVNDKDREINKIKENNMQLNESMKKIPKLIRKIFLKNNKLLN